MASDASLHDQFKPGDRVLWLPYWCDHHDLAMPGSVAAHKPSKPYTHAVQLDGEDGPTAVYGHELTLITEAP